MKRTYHIRVIPRRKEPRPLAQWKRIENEKAGIADVNEPQKKRWINPISDRQKQRNRRYSPIAAEFKKAHPLCECCQLIWNRPPKQTEDVHHMRGKLGELYFMVEFFKATCRDCHTWIGNNPALARTLGLLCPTGQWNTVPHQNN